tara:strand:- start:2862 stop:3170 length:309 start_codon:yes stop_codon:yes gene_type:complete
MALPDLTGQNIQDTYKRVLQVDENGIVYDGTGSLAPTLQVTSSFSISSSHEITYERSSSYAETSSFSNELTVGGNITASSNISASGNIQCNTLIGTINGGTF